MTSFIHNHTADVMQAANGTNPQREAPNILPTNRTPSVNPKHIPVARFSRCSNMGWNEIAGVG